MEFVFLVLGGALGGAGFRIRGGWWGDLWRVPGQASRLVYGVMMAWASCAMGALGPLGWPSLLPMSAALAVAWFIGAGALGTLRAIDAGRNEGTKLGDGLRNAARGLVYVAPAAAVLAVVEGLWGNGAWWWPLACMGGSGAFQGPCYEAAHRWWPMPRYKATEIAEWLTGAVFGLGAALAMWP